MGRGRNNGPVDQSSKKPKVTKNKVRGDLQMFHPHIIEENTELPILVSEDLLAEMKKMSPQKLMNILLPNKNVKRVHFPVILDENTFSIENNCLLSEGIKKLPPELREEIYKEYIKIKLSQRKALGWDEVNAAIIEAPFCDHNQQIVKVLFCYKCGHCMRNYLCNLCRRNGVNHYLGYPIYDEDDYDECFKKSFYSSWCGAVA